MTLEAVVFQPDPFSYGCVGGSISSLSWIDYGIGLGEDDDHKEKGYVDQEMLNNGHTLGQRPIEFCSPSSWRVQSSNNVFSSSPMAATGWRKRRRIRNVKNKEEVESQRITHIAVERNRRKLMNDYLATLRSMMPASYAQRGDQASTIGGAINFVKELEQLLQSLEASRRTNKQSDKELASIFSNFFTFPQYSTFSSPNTHGQYMTSNSVHPNNELTGEKRLVAIADVEVTMVENHANIKVLLKRLPRQLLKMVLGLHSLGLVILHLSVTTMDDMILYSISVKVEDNSQLTSTNEIAADVYEMVGRIQEEEARSVPALIN